jgi:hypothetical protein
MESEVAWKRAWQLETNGVLKDQGTTDVQKTLLVPVANTRGHPWEYLEIKKNKRSENVAREQKKRHAPHMITSASGM